MGRDSLLGNEHSGVFEMAYETMAALQPQDTSLLIGAIDIGPVFRGLTDGGISGKALAHMLDVSPSTISKWRRGSARPSGAAIQFLTLMLADQIRSKERTLDAMEDVPLAWRLGRESELAAMRQALATQEGINSILPAAAVRDGARIFKAWVLKTSPARPAMPQPRLRIEA